MFEMFKESWWNMGFSALATQLITSERKIFKNCKIWELNSNQ